jgi:hypothetical protein
MAYVAWSAPKDEEHFPLGRTERFLTWLALAAAAGLIILVGARWDSYQWDFHMFYGAARDFAAGQSPYRGEGLSFYHPPVLLYVYRLFTFMPVPLAYTVWYALKIGALAALFAIWHRDFVRLRWHVSYVVYFVLAFQGAIYADLVAGNVSVFEEVLLWFGFACLLRGQYLLFGVCVVLAAQVKLTPIFFAVLLLLACDRPRWGDFFATVAGFVAVFSLNQWLQPDLFRSFWLVSAQLDERGDNLSQLALIRDVFDRFLGATFTRSSRIDELLFLSFAAAVFLVSWWVVAAYRRGAETIDQRLLICFSCFVLALISPRFKVYTYILLLIPTLYLVARVDWRRVSVAGVVILVLVVFPQPGTLLPFRALIDIVSSHQPLFAAAVIWGVYVWFLSQAAAERPGEAAEKSPSSRPKALKAT